MKKNRIITIILGISVGFLISGCTVDNDQKDFSNIKVNHYEDLGYKYSSPETAPNVSRLSELTESSSLSDYLAYAALNNPGLEAAFNRWKASLEKIAQVKSLPDPKFEYKYYIEEVETRVGPQRQSFSFSQAFPWFGKLDLRGEVAIEQANAARQRYEAEKLKLFFEVKDAYYEYYYLSKSIAITKENVDLIKHLESVAQSRYRAASGRHPDIIRAQVEAGKLEDSYISLLDLQEPIIARLNAVLNRPVQSEIPSPNEIQFNEVDITDEELLSSLIRTNPELKALDFEITKSRKSIELAKKDYYPDLNVGLGFIDTDDSAVGNPIDNGKDPVIASVSINIPLWRGKYDAGVRQAKSQYLAFKGQRRDKTNSLSSELKMALYRFRDAKRKIDLYRDALIPKAKESLKVTESEFRSGNGNFNDLIDAQRILLDFTLSYEKALADRSKSLAKLEMLTGQEIKKSKLKI